MSKFRILTITPEGKHPLKDIDAETSKEAKEKYLEEFPTHTVVNVVFIPDFQYRPLLNPHLEDHYITRELLAGQNWQGDYLHSTKLHEINDTLGQPEYRLILDAIKSGLPVVLSRKIDGYIETYTVVITDFRFSPKESRSSAIRIKRWGFNHEIYLTEIVSVETPEVKYEG